MLSIPTLGHQRLRQGRRSLPGQLYLLTTVTWQRKRYFLDTDLARLAARLLSSEEHWHPSRCLAWVLMPDHWHGLVELGTDQSLGTTMQRIKGISARHVGLQHRHAQPLWTKGFHDHALRNDESVRDVTKYIIANPLRAGLVANVMDYPYWDACFLHTAADLQALG
ncbi:MAG TPA: transposase [Rhodanobacter sp.]|nr:transposase [Rhodanobacter sp.]